MDYKAFVTKILEMASQVAQNNFEKVKGVSVKGQDNNQVLTETDVEIGNLLVAEIKKSYPNCNVIDEEAGVIDNKSEYTWVVDPIDGTSNFIKGIPMYGIMVGLLHKAEPIVGGLAIPSFSEIYYGETGSGAYCNGNKIKVSDENELLNALVSYGIDGHQENPKLTKDECALLANIVLKIRNLRASNSTYDFAMVANGKYEAYLNQTSKIWDNVAPQVIIQEAGGVYSDFDGNKIDYSNPLAKADDNFTYIAAPPTLHKQLVSIIKNNQQSSLSKSQA